MNCWREASDVAAVNQPTATAAAAAAAANPTAATASDATAARDPSAADFYLSNALRLLQRHAGHPSLSLRAVFPLLPGGLQLQQLAPFIRVSLQKQQDAAAAAAVQEKLCSAEYLTVYAQGAKEKSKWIEITQET